MESTSANPDPAQQASFFLIFLFFKDLTGSTIPSKSNDPLNPHHSIHEGTVQCLIRFPKTEKKGGMVPKAKGQNTAQEAHQLIRWTLKIDWWIIKH